MLILLIWKQRSPYNYFSHLKFPQGALRFEYIIFWNFAQNLCDTDRFKKQFCCLVEFVKVPGYRINTQKYQSYSCVYVIKIGNGIFKKNVIWQ